MSNIDLVIDTFVKGDYFILFLVLTLLILLVLVLALIKSRGEYNELLEKEITFKKQEPIQSNNVEEENIGVLDDLSNLMASNSDDVIDENKPLIKQIDTKGIKTYDDIIDEYEFLEEENAVISADELEKKTKERMDNFGSSENQEAIHKYEEEQEKKAIISYEQLLKNASNISLSYKEEDSKLKDAPRVNKIEMEQKEMSAPEIYLEEEEFLSILKEFRINLNENIFN